MATTFDQGVTNLERNIYYLPFMETNVTQHTMQTLREDIPQPVHSRTRKKPHYFFDALLLLLVFRKSDRRPIKLYFSSASRAPSLWPSQTKRKPGKRIVNLGSRRSHGENFSQSPEKLAYLGRQALFFVLCAISLIFGLSKGRVKLRWLAPVSVLALPETGPNKCLLRKLSLHLSSYVCCCAKCVTRMHFPFIRSFVYFSGQKRS